MKKLISLALIFCMLLSGSAMAIGRVIQQEPVEVQPYYIDCFDLAGMTREEVQAYLEENNRQLNNVRLQYSGCPKDGELVDLFSGFYGDGGGIGVYGLSVNLDFDENLNEEMLADGWVITSRQFEGGFWYNRLECPGADGKTKYTMYVQTNGSKIMYMEFKILNLMDYLAEKAAAEAAE